MPIVPWACAHGEAPPVTLRCSSTVDIAPADDSVDTNLVIIEGRGEIDSFGSGPGGFIRKQIVFRPSAPTLPGDLPAPGGGGPKPTITIRHNPPWLLTATQRDRVITSETYAEFVCNDVGNWFELFFTATGAAAYENLIEALDVRVNDLEQRLAKLERKKAKRTSAPTED